MKFIQISDLHLDDFLSEKYGIDARGNLRSMLDSLRHEDFDFLYLSGDLGSGKSHQWLSSQLDGLNVPYYLCLGNHDSYDEILSSSLKTAQSGSPNELYYSFNFGGFTFVVLDTGKGDISNEQLNWLKESMREIEEEVYLFCHYPILSVDPVFERYLGHKRREEIKEILESSRKKVKIFAGHYHSASFTESGRITQYVCPASIMQINSRDGSLISESFHWGRQEVLVEPGRTHVRRIIDVSNRKVKEGE